MKRSLAAAPAPPLRRGAAVQDPASGVQLLPSDVRVHNLKIDYTQHNENPLKHVVRWRASPWLPAIGKPSGHPRVARSAGHNSAPCHPYLPCSLV